MFFAHRGPNKAKYARTDGQLERCGSPTLSAEDVMIKDILNILSGGPFDSTAGEGRCLDDIELKTSSTMDGLEEIMMDFENVVPKGAEQEEDSDHAFPSMEMEISGP